jgi:hypothetical protein
MVNAYGSPISGRRYDDRVSKPTRQQGETLETTSRIHRVHCWSSRNRASRNRILHRQTRTGETVNRQRVEQAITYWESVEQEGERFFYDPDNNHIGLITDLVLSLKSALDNDKM